MWAEFIKKICFKKTILPLLSLIGFLIIMYVDKNYLHINVFQYGQPNFSGIYLVRTLIIIIICIALFYFPLIELKKTKEINLDLLKEKSTTPEEWAIKIITILSLFFVFLSLIAPNVFNNLSKEDNIIEWGSAILLFAASFVFFIVFLKKPLDLFSSKQFRWLALCFSLVFFVVAMEEISWFQRVIEYDTPKAFDSNLQQEFNLHNFNTNYSENIYYLASFIFLVVLPYINMLFPNLLNFRNLKVYVPRPFILFIGMIPCSYNFDRWDALTTQFTFFSCIIILFSLLFFKINKKEKIFISFFVLFLITQQTAFLGNESNLLNMFDIKEYKELFIPMVFFMYSLDVFSLLEQKNKLPKKINWLL